MTLQCGRDVDSKHIQWQALEGLGALSFNAGHFEKAVEYFKQSLSVLALTGDVKNMVGTRVVVADRVTDVIHYLSMKC